MERRVEARQHERVGEPRRRRQRRPQGAEPPGAPREAGDARRHQHARTPRPATTSAATKGPLAPQLAKCRPVETPRATAPAATAPATPSAASASRAPLAREPRHAPPPHDDQRHRREPRDRHRHDEAPGLRDLPRRRRTPAPTRATTHQRLRERHRRPRGDDGRGVEERGLQRARSAGAAALTQPASSRTARETAKRRTASARARCSGARERGIARQDGPRVLLDALDPRGRVLRIEPGEVLHDARLPRSAEVPRAAEREVGARDLGAVGRPRQRLEAAAREVEQRLVVHEHAAPRALAAADATAELVQLREAEALRAVDDHQRRLGHVDARPR